MPRNVEFIYTAPSDSLDSYALSVTDGKLTVEGTSPVAICKGFYDYILQNGYGISSWTGNRLDMPSRLPEMERKEVVSPFRDRLYYNVCTYGYTTPFWDWKKWEQELDWVALHGFDMPLAPIAGEAIFARVWEKLGLSYEEIDEYFSGPAHMPWMRMGNMSELDGGLSREWHEEQIALQHKILDRMRSLGMTPVCQGFAGFVPKAMKKHYPEIDMTTMEWCGFESYIMSPLDSLFSVIGTEFIREWEKEFGKCRYYLVDSFNEMDIPFGEKGSQERFDKLQHYGKTIYNSIASANPDAVWVTQGWTFGNRHWFWEKESLQALLSQVPDDKMIIIDLANDYPKWVWNIDLTWKRHDGFYGKKWIYSFTPNFGGKHLPTGDMNMYASGFAEALNSPVKGNLVGVGSAPEGLDNNDVVYELLADAAWSERAIDLDEWYANWCESRYGCADETMLQAWKLFHETVYSSLYSYPRYRWQTVTFDKRRPSRHDINDSFGEGVRLFLSCRDKCSDSPLYVADAIELSAFWIAELADRHWKAALDAMENGNMKEARAEKDKTVELLLAVDGILAAHPERNLTDWVELARAAADTPELKDKYEADAKRLVTIWGGAQEDYAARMWAGLIKDYYIPRLEKHLDGQDKAAMAPWKEEWLAAPYESSSIADPEPLETAVALIECK